MSRYLRHKLTVFYIGLFVGALCMISLAVYVAAVRHVEQIGRAQLTTSAKVFENLIEARNDGLQNEADILAHDYGFRAAVATHDDATVRSALDNLASRLGIELAFVVDIDGRVAAQVADGGLRLPPDVVQAVQADNTVSGTFQIGGAPYAAVAAPIRTPAPAGWVVFAKRLNAKDMSQLERVSAIPLKASVLARRDDGRWAAADGGLAQGPNTALQGLIVRAVRAPSAAVRLNGPGDASLVLVRPLPALGGTQQVALMLRYPLADELKPFRPLFGDILIIGAVGVLLLVVASWVIAAALTDPISALEDAARGLQRGKAARVVVKTRDEIGRLSLAFNAMADHIEDREAKIIQARDLAEAADRAKTEFLANMNHEFRTPLNGVLGTVSVLSTSSLKADQQQMLDMIETSGRALERVLNDVLDMVELSSGSITLCDEPFDLNAVLQRLVDETSAAAQAKNLAFFAELNPTELSWVRGDPRQVSQILARLLSNAVKFTNDGQVVLCVSQKEGVHQFEVRDSGVGFDPAHTEAMFRPFNQADGSLTRRFGGAGLGLSLARAAARAMGGEITATGAPGLGAQFNVTLPLSPCAAPVAHEAQIQTAARTPMGDDSPALRVLLAEDHPTNRALVSMILESVGVDVVSVENGAEAVEAFKVQAFDVVLMDIQMPVMDGLTAIRLIREHEGAHAHTPILVLSANAQREHLRASAEAGADQHIAKPITAPTLIAALEQVLDPRTSDPENSLAFG